GAKILGNIEVGHGTRVAAGSVLLTSVPNNKTVAGVPGRIVGGACCEVPSRSMDHVLHGQEKAVCPNGGGALASAFTASRAAWQKRRIAASSSWRRSCAFEARIHAGQPRDRRIQ